MTWVVGLLRWWPLSVNKALCPKTSTNTGPCPVTSGVGLRAAHTNGPGNGAHEEEEEEEDKVVVLGDEFEARARPRATVSAKVTDHTE